MAQHAQPPYSVGCAHVAQLLCCKPCMMSTTAQIERNPHAALLLFHLLLVYHTDLNPPNATLPNVPTMGFKTKNHKLALTKLQSSSGHYDH